MPRMTVVLEGVLCTIETSTTGKRMRKKTHTHLDWMETPLKGLVDMRRRFPDVAIDVVTFSSQDIMEAVADFFGRHGIWVNRVYYEDYGTFCSMLRFRIDVLSVYDSDEGRLIGYGQKGVSVQRGWAF